MFSHSYNELGVLLDAFLRDEAESSTRLRSFLKPIVHRYCAKKAEKLPRDLRDDVLQETILLLFSKASQYKPERCTAPGFMYSIIRSALQSVRRRHGMSGARASDVSLETPGLQEVAVVIAPVSFCGLTSQAQIRVLALRALQVAGPAMASALWRVYVEEEPQDEVLRDFSISRFAFIRRRKAVLRSLNSLSIEQREAA